MNDGGGRVPWGQGRTVRLPRSGSHSCGREPGRRVCAYHACRRKAGRRSFLSSRKVPAAGTLRGPHVRQAVCGGRDGGSAASWVGGCPQAPNWGKGKRSESPGVSRLSCHTASPRPFVLEILMNISKNKKRKYCVLRGGWGGGWGLGVRLFTRSAR